MRISRTAWAGIACVLLGLAVFASWDTWLQTRNTRPIYMPVSLAPGEVTAPQFRVNLSAQYTLEIEARKTIPFETLNCLLGMSLMPDQKCDRPSVIKANWTLMSGGRVVQTGTSDTDDGGTWAQDTIAREFGTFWLTRGQVYVLHTQFSLDGRVLAPTDPHLKIEVHPDFYEGTMFTSYFLLRKCEWVVALGLLILAVSCLKWLWRRRNIAELSTKGPRSGCITANPEVSPSNIPAPPPQPKSQQEKKFVSLCR
jgi:hypothetical protein